MSVKFLVPLLGLAALLLLAAQAPLAASPQPPAPNKYLYTIGAPPAVGAFRTPSAVAVAPHGDIYLADTANARIQRFAPDGGFVAAWGQFGDGDGQFHSPVGLAVAPDSTVYVADSVHGDIQRFTPNGALLKRWGSPGRGPGQFGSSGFGSGLTDVAVGPDGTVYAADLYNNRIQRFTADGGFLGEWATRDATGYAVEPLRVNVAPTGRVYVAVNNGIINHPGYGVLMYTPTGAYVGGWGFTGGLVGFTGGLVTPRALTIGPDNRVYVADSYNTRIQVFTLDGTFITSWLAANDVAALAAAPDGTLYAAEAIVNRVDHVTPTGDLLNRWEGGVVGAGELVTPHALALGPEGTLYVGDWDTRRIHRFDMDGRALGNWSTEDTGIETHIGAAGLDVTPAGVVYVADRWNDRVLYYGPTGAYLGMWPGTFGSEPGQLDHESDIAVAPDGTLYVADTGNNRVQQFTPDGQLLKRWGSAGVGAGQFNQPRGIVVSPRNEVYVADTGNNRVQRFTASGHFLNAWSAGVPIAIALGPDGTVYVADLATSQIMRFTADGEFMDQWGGLGSSEQKLSGPTGIVVAPDGRVYVADTENGRVQVFGPASPATWRAEYHANRWLAARPLVITQTADIAFDWGLAAPDPALPADTFSARFTRRVPFESNFYRFTVEAQGGVRLWVDGQLLVDQWDGPTVASGGLAGLDTGEHALRLEYNDPGGPARVHLTWQPVTLPPRLSLPLIEARPSEPTRDRPRNTLNTRN